MKPVDRHADAPPFKQIAAQVRALIADGTYALDDKLPSESAMSLACQVSRATVRQALGLLKVEGLVEARHGVGVFVTRPLSSDPLLAFARWVILLDSDIDARRRVSLDEIVDRARVAVDAATR